MKEIETSKLYYGFPVYILGYKDEDFGYNITTSSSSYTLGDMLTMGIFNKGNAAKKIREFKEFTLNLPSESLMYEIEVAGFNSSKDKLKMTNLNWTRAEGVDAPLLTDCLLSLECHVEQIQEFDSYLNIIARITKRWVSEELLDEKGRLKSSDLAPIYYMGDGHKRIYRYQDERSDALGTFIKR
ncbi:MAG: flavin reductase family protein [Streptococcus sp.]|nr:flavin reductase family protein [Streptococcus sp.]